MPQHDAQVFLAQLPAIRNDLPFSPALLRTLFVQTGADSLSSLEDVAETISRDQGLTTRLLALANSAFYGLQAEVASVRRAATVLGLREIRSLVLALGIRGLTRGRPLPPAFDLRGYWRHQARAAVLARWTARRAGLSDADDLFTAGLLHDLGKLITALYRPDVWTAVHALVAAEDLEEVVAEERYWGLDHAVIGALVLKNWDFPPALVEPLNWHHAPELAGEYRPQAMVVGLADLLAHDGEGGPVAAAVRGVRIEAACRDLELDAVELRAEADGAVEAAALESLVTALG